MSRKKRLINRRKEKKLGRNLAIHEIALRYTNLSHGCDRIKRRHWLFAGLPHEGCSHAVG